MPISAAMLASFRSVGRRLAGRRDGVDPFPDGVDDEIRSGREHMKIGRGQRMMARNVRCDRQPSHMVGAPRVIDGVVRQVRQRVHEVLSLYKSMPRSAQGGQRRLAAHLESFGRLMCSAWARRTPFCT
jgi:hypothetical protein